MDPIFVAIGGVMIGAGVHFIPVGGAPAAMATATGVGTGTAMLAAGAGLTGLITAATMTGEPWFVVGIGGAIGAMIMMGITMLIANFIYVYGVGIVPAASKVPVDIITKRNQEKYKTPGTEGHGVPTTCFISGVAVFFINAVIASYNIGGTIEGMHDPKFKRIGRGALSCAIASIVVGVFCVLLTGGI